MVIIRGLEGENFILVLLHFTFKFTQLFIQIFDRQLKLFDILLIDIGVIDCNIPELCGLFVLEYTELLDSLVHEINPFTSLCRSHPSLAYLFQLCNEFSVFLFQVLDEFRALLILLNQVSDLALVFWHKELLALDFLPKNFLGRLISILI